MGRPYSPRPGILGPWSGAVLCRCHRCVRVRAAGRPAAGRLCSGEGDWERAPARSRLHLATGTRPSSRVRLTALRAAPSACPRAVAELPSCLRVGVSHEGVRHHAFIHLPVEGHSGCSHFWWLCRTLCERGRCQSLWGAHLGTLSLRM